MICCNSPQFHFSLILYESSPPFIFSFPAPSLHQQWSPVVPAASQYSLSLCVPLSPFPLSPLWGCHPWIWWTSEVLILAGGFPGRPHMNGLTGRGGATSEEFGRDPSSCCSSLSVSTVTSSFGRGGSGSVCRVGGLYFPLVWSGCCTDGLMGVCAAVDGAGGARAAAAVQEWALFLVTTLKSCLSSLLHLLGSCARDHSLLGFCVFITCASVCNQAESSSERLLWGGFPNLLAAEVGGWDWVQRKRLNLQRVIKRLWLEGSISMVTAAFAKHIGKRWRKLLTAACPY